jgi:hypothetical protein
VVDFTSKNDDIIYIHIYICMYVYTYTYIHIYTVYIHIYDPRLFPWPDSILYVKCALHTNEYGPLNRGHIHKREGKKPKKKGGVKLEDVDSGHSSSPFSILS